MYKIDWKHADQEPHCFVPAANNQYQYLIFANKCIFRVYIRYFTRTVSLLQLIKQHKTKVHIW